MDGINKVMLLGNLGKDAELFAGKAEGSSVCKFSLATTSSWKDGAGQWKNETQWHSCVVFGRRADALAKGLTKGRRVYVEGALRYGTYEKDGVTKYTTDVVVDKVTYQSANATTEKDPLDEDDDEKPPF